MKKKFITIALITALFTGQRVSADNTDNSLKKCLIGFSIAGVSLATLILPKYGKTILYKISKRMEKKFTNFFKKKIFTY